MTVMRPLTAAIVTCAITAGCTSATVPTSPSIPAAAPSAAVPSPPATPATTVEIRTTVQGQPLAGATIEVRHIGDLSLIATGILTDEQGLATLSTTDGLKPGTVVHVQATSGKTVLSALFQVPPSGFATAQATRDTHWLLDHASSVAARKLTSKLAEVLRSAPAGTPTDFPSLMNQVATLVAETRQALNSRFTDERVNAALRDASTTPSSDSIEALANALIRFSPLRSAFVGAVDACNGQIVTNLLAGGALVAPSPWQIADIRVTPPQLTVAGDGQIRITYAGRAETITVERAAAALAAANAASTATNTNQTFAQVNTTIVPGPATSGGGSGTSQAVPYTGNYTITDAASLAAIQTYESINGNLTVGSTGLASIDLPRLKTISGNLLVNSTDLETLDLPALRSVGGHLIIQNTSALTTVTGTPGVTSLGGNLTVRNNAALTDLSALTGLTTVTGSLNIQQNNALTAISSLPNLATIGNSLIIRDNTALTAISALANLTTIGGNLTFKENTVLTSISSLANLANVGGDLIIESCPALTDLSWLGQLTSIGSSLSIKDNAALSNLSGLSNLTSTSRVTITNNATLASLAGLSGLTSLQDSLTISNNNALTSLSELSSLSSVQVLTVKDNAELTTLDLAALSTVTSLFAITGNPKLPTDLAQALLDQLASAPLSVTISANGN